MKKEFKIVKIGFLATSIRTQDHVYICRHYARVCKLELVSV